METVELSPKAVIYARCSTKSQNKNNRESLEIQTNTCTNFCSSKDFNVINIVTEICSARTVNKQKNLTNLINTHTNINLIVYDVSRFSRNIIDGLKLLEICIKNNIKLYSVKENICISCMSDLYFITPFLTAAQAESDSISFRVTQAIAYKKSQGGYFGKKKYGFNIVEENGLRKQISIIHEQLIIKLILKLKYGSHINDINYLYNQIKSTENNNINGINDNIIMYGNYNNKDIVYILDLNEIIYDYKDNIWTPTLIQTIIKNNIEQIRIKEEYTDNLILKLYKINTCLVMNLPIEMQEIHDIHELYFHINGYNLNDNDRLIERIYNKLDIIEFINFYKLNFRVWHVSDLSDYDEEIFINRVENNLNRVENNLIN